MANSGIVLAVPIGDHSTQAGREISLSILGELSAEIAHELRNVLGLLSSTAYLARAALDEGDPEETRNRIDRVEALSREAHAVVSNILALTEPLSREEVAPDIIVSRAREVLPEHSGTFRDRLLVSRSPSTHAGLFTILLRILYTNALQASKEATIMTTFAEEPGGGVRIDVSDDGPGIAPHLLSSLFEPLVSGRAHGSGLGLALARRIVEAHRGTLEVIPSEKGAHFRVRIADAFA